MEKEEFDKLVKSLKEAVDIKFGRKKPSRISVVEKVKKGNQWKNKKKKKRKKK